MDTQGCEQLTRLTKCRREEVGGNGYAGLKRVVEAEKWWSSLSRETVRASLARERERERDILAEWNVERTKFVFKRTTKKK